MFSKVRALKKKCDDLHEEIKAEIARLHLKLKEPSLSDEEKTKIRRRVEVLIKHKESQLASANGERKGK